MCASGCPGARKKTRRGPAGDGARGGGGSRRVGRTLVVSNPPTPTGSPPSARSLRAHLAAPLAPGFALRAHSWLPGWSPYLRGSASRNGEARRERAAKPEQSDGCGGRTTGGGGREDLNKVLPTPHPPGHNKSPPDPPPAGTQLRSSRPGRLRRSVCPAPPPPRYLLPRPKPEPEALATAS